MGPEPVPGVTGYLVVRKADSSPAHEKDGTEIGRTTAERRLDDPSGPPGRPLFYAVFALRGNVLSTAARPSNPAFLIHEVSALVARGGDRHVQLTWKSPVPGLKIVVVRNAARNPKDLQDGDRVPAGEGTLLDRDVKNDQDYHYGLFCVYRTAGGEAVSRGTFVTVRPTPPPVALGSFAVSVEADGIRLRWSAPPRGEVAILRSPQRPAEAKGTVLGLDHLAKIGTPIPSVGISEAFDARPLSGPAFYVAVTRGPNVAVVGDVRLVAKIRDATGVRIEKNGQETEASWMWPVEGTLAQVSWRSDAYPSGADDPVAQTLTVGRKEYDRKGGVTVPHRAGADLYLTVYMGITTPEGPLYAAGEGESARAFSSGKPKVNVEYRLHKPMFGARSFRFTSDRPCELPELVFVAKAGMLPIDVDAGRIVARYPRLTIPPDGATVPFPPASKGDYVLAFFTDPDNYDRYLILEPKMEDLRVA